MGRREQPARKSRVAKTLAHASNARSGNRWVEQVAKEKKLGVIDLYAAMTGRADLIPDGVHPNAAGAKNLAETIRAALTTK